jgi:transcriptional regulator with XRE-family HTH domain
LILTHAVVGHIYVPVSKLKKRREALGMRREELAVKAGISFETVRRLEANPAEANPTLEVARGIADALDTTIDELFPVVEPETAPEAQAR